MNRHLTVLLSLAALASAGAAAAHTAWLERDARPGVWRMFFGGHLGALEPVVPAKIRGVTAVDERGRPLRVERTVSGSEVRVAVAGRPAMIALHYDNGIHSSTGTGPSVERPMNEVRGATRATNAQKYSKLIVHWTPIVTRPIGQPFEVVPMSGEQPRAGRPMRLQVRIDGRPAAGVSIGLSAEDPNPSVTDAAGVATVIPAAGYNNLWSGHRIELRGEPRYTQLSYEYRFAFDAR